MKSFIQFLEENNKSEQTPHGVLFLKNEKGEDTHAIVGTAHRESVKIPDHIMSRINKIKENHGIYYEGDGGDIKYHEKLFGPKKAYSGSWDEGTSIDKKNPPSWIHTVLFSNHKENNAVDQIMKHHRPGDTLEKTIQRSGFNLITHESKDGTYVPQTDHLRDFFHKMGMSDDANKETTRESLTEFLDKGEKQMWPDDWLTNKSNGASIAREMVFSRQNNIFNKQGGVFVAGSGHVLAAKQRANDEEIPHELIGGSEAA